MRGYVVLVGLVASSTLGCAPTVNVEQERATLLAVDQEWSQSANDVEKFASYFAPDASVYPQGMPIVQGSAAIKETFAQMSAAPGFSLAWTPAKAEVGAGGDVGYTAGAYNMSMAGASEVGKYVTVWKKQPGGDWKVVEDIFNADAMPEPPATQHAMIAPAAVKWGDPPPSLPPGARIAVIAGDPTQPQPFVIRAQVPAGYRVAPHWHPGDENITVLSGTVALGMGDTFDQAAMTDIPVGGYAALPKEMHHYFLSKTASTFQVHGMGPFAVNYVNAADDPSKKSP